MYVPGVSCLPSSQSLSYLRYLRTCCQRLVVPSPAIPLIPKTNGKINVYANMRVRVRRCRCRCMCIFSIKSSLNANGGRRSPKKKGQGRWGARRRTHVTDKMAGGAVNKAIFLHARHRSSFCFQIEANLIESCSRWRSRPSCSLPVCTSLSTKPQRRPGLYMSPPPQAMAAMAAMGWCRCRRSFGSSCGGGRRICKTLSRQHSLQSPPTVCYLGLERK